MHDGFHIINIDFIISDLRINSILLRVYNIYILFDTVLLIIFLSKYYLNILYLFLIKNDFICAFTLFLDSFCSTMSKLDHRFSCFFFNNNYISINSAAYIVKFTIQRFHKSEYFSCKLWFKLISFIFMFKSQTPIEPIGAYYCLLRYHCCFLRCTRFPHQF